MNNQKVGDVKIIKPSIDSSQDTLNELLLTLVDAVNELNWHTPEEWLTQTLQDTINTALEGERKRTLEILTTTINANQMLRGWERYWKEVEPNRFVENCIECENTSRILKTLDKTPPDKV